jgi:hypothetical protein
MRAVKDHTPVIELDDVEAFPGSPVTDTTLSLSLMLNGSAPIRFGSIYGSDLRWWRAPVKVPGSRADFTSRKRVSRASLIFAQRWVSRASCKTLGTWSAKNSSPRSISKRTKGEEC